MISTTTPEPTNFQEAMRIARRLVRRFYGEGFQTSVRDEDGERHPPKATLADAYGELGHTDWDELLVWHTPKIVGGKPRCLGSVSLIYENGCDVISDHSMHPMIAGMVDAILETEAR